ncbi:MAG: hypothetical protein FWG64_09200 [Firmicutes bacterium]|nr:hypothetical protein [Bacillota bacterium]
MIRTVDLAIPIQRVTEMTQLQRGENRPDAQHQQFAARLNKETELQEQQVQEAPKSEDAQIRKDGRGNSGYGGGKNKKKNKQQEEKSKATQASTSMFDITM